jgi:hypothetical protein
MFGCICFFFHKTELFTELSQTYSTLKICLHVIPINNFNDMKSILFIPSYCSEMFLLRTVKSIIQKLFSKSKVRCYSKLILKTEKKPSIILFVCMFVLMESIHGVIRTHSSYWKKNV